MGISSPRGTTFGHNKVEQTTASTLSYGENPESLSDLGLNRYRVVRDRHNYDS